MRDRTLSARLVRMTAPGAKDQARAVRVRQKAELLGQDIAGFEIRRQQNVGIAGNAGTNAFDSAAFLLMALSKANGPSRTPPVNLSAFRHLAERCRVNRGRHLGGDGFHRGENRDLGLFETEGDRQIDGVLADVDFVFQRGSNIDGGIGHDQHFVIRGTSMINTWLMAPRASPTSLATIAAISSSVWRLPSSDFGPAFADQLNSLRGRGVTVRNVDDLQFVEIDSGGLGNGLDLCCRPHQNWPDTNLFQPPQPLRTTQSSHTNCEPRWERLNSCTSLAAARICLSRASKSCLLLTFVGVAQCPQLSRRMLFHPHVWLGSTLGP